jgi:hypothetical protein
MVVKWYETWRTAPQSKQFIDTDWQRLGMVAYLFEQYLADPKSTILSEIRLNEERLGATVVDRQRARMVIEPTDGKDASVLSLVPGSSARERIAKRAAEE